MEVTQFDKNNIETDKDAGQSWDSFFTKNLSR